MRSRLSLAVRRQKKLLLLFVLTIVGPAVALAVFGLRALDADRYRVQELLRREQEEAFRSTRAILLSDLELIAESLGPLSEELRGMTNWEAIYRTVYDHVRKRTIRGRVVVLGSRGEFFFASDGFLVPARPQVEPSDGEWGRYHETQKLESDDASRAVAASSFLEIAAATKDRRLRMTALNAAGRSSFNLGRYSEAAAAYRSLVDDWPPPIDSEIAALPLMAGLKLGASLERQGADALPVLVDVYREMLERRWIVSVSTVEYYSEEYERAIDAHCRKRGSQVACREYRELRERKPARLARLRELEDARAFLAAALRPEAAAASGGRRVVPVPGGACLAVVSRAVTESRGGSSTSELAVATILEETALLERLVAARAKQGHAVQLRIARPDRTVLYASSPANPAAIFLEQELGDGLPPWKVTLFHDPRDAAAFWRRSVGSTWR